MLLFVVRPLCCAAQKLAAMPPETNCASILKRGTSALVFPTLALSCTFAVGAVGWLIFPLLFGMSRQNKKYNLRY